MRAVTAVLCAAGNLKRAFPTAPEDVLMLRAINDGGAAATFRILGCFYLLSGTVLVRIKHSHECRANNNNTALQGNASPRGDSASVF